MAADLAVEYGILDTEPDLGHRWCGRRTESDEPNTMSGLARRRGSAIESVVWPVLGVGVAIAALELGLRLGILPRQSFPPASEIFRALGNSSDGSELWGAVGDTLASWARRWCSPR